MLVACIQFGVADMGHRIPERAPSVGLIDDVEVCTQHRHVGIPREVRIG